LATAFGTSGGKTRPTTQPSHTAAASPPTAAQPSELAGSAAGTEPADASVAETPFAGGASVTGLTVTSPDDASLALSQPRLVFSGVRGSPYPPAKSLTLTNTTPSALQLTSLHLAGPNS